MIVNNGYRNYQVIAECTINGTAYMWVYYGSNDGPLTFEKSDLNMGRN